MSPVPPPAQPGQFPDINLQGKPPLKPGRVYMAGDSQQILKELDWKEGDPIPPELGVRMDEMLRESGSRAEAMARLAQTPYAKPSAIQQFESLSDNQKNELRAMLKESASGPAGTATVTTGPSTPPPAPAPTPVQRAAEPSGKPTMEFHDDAGVYSDTPASQPSQPMAGAAPMLQQCPRCNWLLADPIEQLPTTDDERVFLFAKLGGGRYYKDYTLFGGHVVVRFRTLMIFETEIILRQLLTDIKKGRVNADNYRAMQAEYRLAVSFDRITLGENVPILNQDTPEEKVAINEDSFLIERTQWLRRHGIPDESFYRTVGLQHRRFERHVETIESRAENESFSKGIATRS